MHLLLVARHMRAYTHRKYNIKYCNAKTGNNRFII